MGQAAVAASRENKTVGIVNFWVSRRVRSLRRLGMRWVRAACGCTRRPSSVYAVVPRFTGACCAAARRQDDLTGIGGECVGVGAGRWLLCMCCLVGAWVV